MELSYEITEEESWIMAGRRRTRGSKGLATLTLLLVGLAVVAAKAVTEFVSNNTESLIMFGIVIVVFVVILLVTKSIVNNQRRELLSEILSELHLEKID